MKIISLATAFVLALGIGASAKTLEFTMGSNTMYESTDKIEEHSLENAPYTKNDRTMVPARIISERFGADVGWDGEKNEVSITKGDKSIILTLGSDVAVVNGEKIKLDVSPEEFNGRTMVPLRFISETLGKSVRYIPSTAQVVITDNEPLLTINGLDINIDHYKTLILAAGYDKQSGENPLDYVSQVTALMREVYGTGTLIQAEGTYPELMSEVIKEAISANIGYMQESDVLSFPMAEYWGYDELIYLKADDYVKSIDVENEAEELYKELFVTAKHILILADETNHTTAKKTAEAVLKEAKSGKDFDELIDKYNEDPGVAQNPDGYTFTYGEMVEPFEEAAFALKEGEISGIVETSYGYHIIKREPLAPMPNDIRSKMMSYVEGRIPYVIISEAMENVQVTRHKTDEEIAELLK